MPNHKTPPARSAIATMPRSPIGTMKMQNAVQLMENAASGEHPQDPK